MSQSRDAEFIKGLDQVVFHPEKLTDQDRRFIDEFVGKHQLGLYRSASTINSMWIINEDKTSLMFRLGGGIPKDGERMLLAYGVIFKNQPLVIKTDIVPHYSSTEAHWSVIELIVHPNSIFAEFNNSIIFKIIEFFIKNGYRTEYMSDENVEDITVDFSKFKRTRFVRDHRILGYK
jgi:hypothetical protein